MTELCSHCMGSTEGPGAIEVEPRAEKKDGQKPVVLCGFRCLALWAMKLGWRP